MPRLDRHPLNGARALAIACGLLAGAGAVRADKLRIGNVTVIRRDAATATVKFDISWENSWRHGSFHDAAWVFFKVRADGKAGWRHVRLVADKVVDPTGYGRGKGTPLELVVPDGEDGFVGMFVRRSADGKGAVETRNVTAVWDLTFDEGVEKNVKGLRMRAFGIEMVYVAGGPFCLGSGGKELNSLHTYTGDGRNTPPYRVTGAGAILTGRQKGKLWAAGITPENGGEIPAAFPNGYAAFYCMKSPYIRQGQYAGFLGTLTNAQVKRRYYTGYQGHAITRSGRPPNYTYSASAPDERCPWLSWADCAAYAAWAGLRPMTELEYEKAIRGPQDPVPNDAGVSYWGVANVNHGAIYERLVTAGSPEGRRFAGTHGRGTPALPADWPSAFGGVVYRGDFLFLRRYSAIGHLRTSGRSNANSVHADRHNHPYAGWRAARSAPPGDAAMKPIIGRILNPRLPRLDRPVRADGVLDEWGKPALTLGGAGDVFPVYRRFAPFDYYGRFLKPWRGPGDMSSKVYLGRDGEALCVAAEVTDERHVNTKTGSGISSGDAMQMGLVTADGVHWSVGAALTRAGVAFHQWQGRGDTLLKTVGCAVARDEKAKATRYELRLPLAAMGLKPGEELGFNIAFYDDDSNGQCYWLQLAPGLAGRGLATEPPIKLYPRFVLAK
jgi:hypothetical protein